ncbi:hypothetical protein [Aquimarina latercula]|uniref:hypothetical protein n=1 Tax=Aquimarina latercula TaxID=987 RepID=UPI0003FEF318|nr:hypothetical protein [Aquimarina latercula]
MDTEQHSLDYRMYHLLLNEKQFGIKEVGDISKRVLVHWRKTGLLEDHRENQKSGHRNYFSVVDLIWISIIGDLRKMQIEANRIKKCKKGIFAMVKAENGISYPALEYYIAHVIQTNVPVYIILTDTEELLIVNDLVYLDKLKSAEIQNHTAISLNKQIKDTLSDVYEVPDFDEFAGLSIEEIQVLHIIRSKTYKYINITQQDGKITRLEGVEEIDGKFSIDDVKALLKSGKYQNFEIKQHNGQIVCVQRRERRKVVK